jgi:hypothetical protein
MTLTADKMVLVLHTTETMSWPGYSGGSMAPTYTGRPPVGSISGAWRAHFPDEKSSRALVNLSGGVETNTQNAPQVELIGTCDPKHGTSWNGEGRYLAGRDYVYWAKATDAQLAWLADFVADQHHRHGLQLVTAKFNPYPSSYGTNNGDRFTFAEWNAAVGICGHQHVPENLHGDPGYINVPRVIELAKAILGTPVELPPEPEPTPTPDPDPTTDPVEETTLSVLHWNIAGSDQTNGYGDANSYRGDDLGRWAAKLGFEVFLACEAGQYDLRAGVSEGLGITSWCEHAKAIWYRSTRVKNIKSRKSYRDSLFPYLSTYKYGAAFFGEKNGKKFSVLEIHTDWRKPALQAKQVQSIFRKWRVDTDALGIKHVNTFVVGDFNWDYTSGDNPFNALAAWNFKEWGSRTAATFYDGRHLDGVLAHETATIAVDVKPRYDGNMKLSDHYPVKFVATLK